MTYRPTRAQAISTIEDLLKTLKADHAEAERMAKNLARATGFPTRTLGDGASRGTGGVDEDGEPLPPQSDPTAHAAERGPDRYEDADVKLRDQLAKVVVECELLRRYVRDLVSHAVAEEQHEGEALVRPTRAGEGECLGCGRPVPGTEGDRLRGGACSACTMAWTRHAAENPHADRVLFMRNRPRYDAEPAAPAEDLEAKGPVSHIAEATRWSNGETTDVTDELRDSDS